jgi:putative SOS response-associated peptidase YedK
MCGRFSIATPFEELRERFKAEPPKVDFKPIYNGAPGRDMLVITSVMPKQMSLFHWGLVPSWAKDPKIGYRMINARAETLSEKPAFRHAFQKNRCLVLADGFFEWDKNGKVHTPYYIYLKEHKPFAFAGLCEYWKDEKGQELNSFTIVTTNANSLIGKIHDRMPVILEPQGEEKWLNPNAKIEDVKKLLKPLPVKEMEDYPISTLVNNPRNNIAEILVKSGVHN